MDSYTLFGHVVDVVGSINCQRAHIELQGLGVLPVASLEDNPPLKQDDADARAALSLWCGLANDPKQKFSSKQFFTQLGNGKGKAPLSNEGDNFLIDLAEVLRRGPEAMGVKQIFVSHVVTNFDGFNGKAQIEYDNGCAENYSVGQTFPATHQSGVILDFKRLRSIHEDLLNTPRSWPQEEAIPVSRLRFKDGAIIIENHGEK